MNLDYLSDIHIDLWVDSYAPEYAQRKKIEEFIVPFIPKTPSKILIIAGDIGHNNEQNFILFEILKKYYEWIFWNEGNHDIYLYQRGQRERYEYDSFKRLQNMIFMASEIKGVVYLGGVTEVEGIKIGGFPMWYDASYGVEVCGKSSIFINQLWRMMPCSRYIFTNGFENPRFKWQEYCSNQKKILEKFYKECDVIFSHVSPDWSQIKPFFANDPMSTFFHFDGREILKNCKGKIWVHGHTHAMYDYHTDSGCHIICNPLGNPGREGSYGQRDIESFSIKTFSI